VIADTRQWRQQTDQILAYWDDCLVAAVGAAVVASDLLEHFNTRLKASGCSEWPKELFASRFKAHEETHRHHVQERRPRSLDSFAISRPAGASSGLPERPRLYAGVRFRAVDEIRENAEEPPDWSGRSNPIADLPDPAQGARLSPVLDQSDRFFGRLGEREDEGEAAMAERGGAPANGLSGPSELAPVKSRRP